MIPSIGRIVHYKMREQDCRNVLSNISHNEHVEGDVYPAMIVRVWGDTEESAVNLQVFYDGVGVLWVTSAAQGEELGQWFEPPRV